MNVPALSLLMYSLLAAGNAATEPMGRLFFTPAEREELERSAEASLKQENPAAPEASSLIVNGVIKRRDGRRIVWINGKPLEMEASDTLSIVHVPAEGKRPAIDARVGQAVPLHPQGISPAATVPPP